MFITQPKIPQKAFFRFCLVLFPSQVNGLRFIAITKGQVLILWNDHCIGTK